ncbi:MAG: tail fiber domain-containing protein [Saprospiraceae bacterium]|nr:tail fiber domain-containing protein [Saprospiraceae bacterium]
MEYSGVSFFLNNNGTWKMLIGGFNETFLKTDFLPDATNSYKLGNTNRRWLEVWSQNGLLTTSDSRLKKDITPLSGSLNKVLQMNPVSYKWKKGDDDTHLGFLAQEMESILPDVVKKPQVEKRNAETEKLLGNADSAYGVNYSEIIPVLVKAIQEQQAVINALEARLAKVENK